MKSTTFGAALALVLAVATPAQDDKKKLADAVDAARKAYDAGRYDEADRCFDPVATLAVGDFDAMLLRARVNLAREEYGRAVTFADNALKIDPKSLDALRLSGEAFFAAGDAARNDGRSSDSRVKSFYDNCAEAFDKAIAIKPDDADLWEWKGHAKYWAGEERWKDSSAAFEKAIELKPDRGDAYNGLARTELARQNKARALEIAAKGLLCKDLSDATAADLARVVFQGYGPAQKFDEASAAFKAWSEAHPKDPAPYVWMGYVKAVANRDDDAIPLYVKAFELSDKKNSLAAYELGMAFFRKNDFEKSAEWHRSALAAQPAGWGAEDGPLMQIIACGNEFVKKGDFAKAVQIAEKNALPFAGDSWRVLNTLGLWNRDWADSLGRRGDAAKAKNEAALKHYAKAVEVVLKDPNASANWKARLINDLGVIHDYQFGDLEKGVKEYRRALEFDPEWIDALENLGLAMNKLAKYEEAIPLFKKALEQEPQRGVSRRGLAEAEKKLKK